MAVLIVAAVLVAAAGAVSFVALRERRRAVVEAASLRRDREEGERSGALAINRLAGALSVLDHGVVIVDDRGEEVLRNERAAAIVTGDSSSALVSDLMRDLVAAALRGEPGEDEVDLFGPPRRTLHIVAKALENETHPMGAAVVIEDVTERRRLEDIRRDFVANISHELKTPVGALGLLAETIAGEDDPQVTQRLAERMQNEAIRVGRIIEDLLDLSRIESDEAPRHEPVSVGDVVTEATDRLSGAAAARGVALTVHDVGDDLVVDGDRRQLVSAVHGLVENAVAYTDAGGSVDVTASREGGRVVVTVADTGVGIPARDLDRIFERFYRVDRARARATGGTGLGLSIVRNVANNHGGQVHVDSREGVGSTFRLELPDAARTSESRDRGDS